MPADAPDAVIFDNDGLTLDTEIVWTRAEETLFERRGLRFTHEYKLELIGSAQEVAAGKLVNELLKTPGDHNRYLQGVKSADQEALNVIDGILKG